MPSGKFQRLWDHGEWGFERPSELDSRWVDDSFFFFCLEEKVKGGMDRRGMCLGDGLGEWL